METIIVSVDGASNIKLEVFDFDNLSTVFSRITDAPQTEVNGLKYDCIVKECSWFDSVIRDLPLNMKTVKVIAPVARGASGGMIGLDNTFVELPPDGYQWDIIVQGTVDGQPVVTARYGGGNDFKYIKELVEERGSQFGGNFDERLLEEVISAADCFVLPNINPINF